MFVYCLVGCGYVVALAVSDGVDARRGRVGMSPTKHTYTLAFVVFLQVYA